jgi:hypothetical protein
VVLIALDVDVLDVPGNLRFFEGASYGRLTLTLMIPNDDIALRIVVAFTLVVGVSTIALSHFFDQAIVLFKLIWNATSSIKTRLLLKLNQSLTIQPSSHIFVESCQEKFSLSCRNRLS